MNPIRCAIIGLGRKGTNHLVNLAGRPQLYAVSAICDNAPDRLAKEYAGTEEAKRYSSLDEVLKDPSIELVTIATRHKDHVPMAIKILESGRFCGIEKPCATSVAEMERLIECAKHHPGKLFLLHNRRFEPAFVKARKLAASGLFGKINYVKLYRSIGYCRRNDWMTIPEYCGGLLTNWGPHLIDQALRWLDSPVKDLWADMRHCISIGAGDDLFKILLKGENGRLVDVEVSGCTALPGREMEIICDRGTIVFENNELRCRYVDPEVIFKPLKPHHENPPLKYGNFDEKLFFVESRYDAAGDCDDTLWKSIAASIRENAPYPIRLEEGLEVVRVTEEVVRRSGFMPEK